MKHPLRFSEHPLTQSLKDFSRVIAEYYQDGHFASVLGRTVLEYFEATDADKLTAASQRSLRLIFLPLWPTPVPVAIRNLII